MFNHVYTIVFGQELPDRKAVKQIKKDLRRLFEAEEVSTSDNRRFSITTTFNDRMAETAVHILGLEHQRKFAINGSRIEEVQQWRACGNAANSRWSQSICYTAKSLAAG